MAETAATRPKHAQPRHPRPFEAMQAQVSVCDESMLHLAQRVSTYGTSMELAPLGAAGFRRKDPRRVGNQTNGARDHLWYPKREARSSANRHTCHLPPRMASALSQPDARGSVDVKGVPFSLDRVVYETLTSVGR